MYKTITNANAKEFELIVRKGTISLISKKKGKLQIKKEDFFPLKFRR